MKLSGIIIARNEEEMIADAIESLSFCDEVLVVDNASTDKTADIAEKKGAKVVKDNARDFSKLRKLGRDSAKGEWLFYLDSDERASKELGEEIVRIIKNNEANAYKVKRKNYYLGNNEWPSVEKMERLFKKDKLTGWKGELHESPVYEGEALELDNHIKHLAHRDLSSMLNKTLEWSDIEAKNRYNAHHPKISWWRIPRVMIPAFFNSFIKQRGYKKGTAGFIEGMYQAFSIFITYAKLWELQRKIN